MTKNDLITHRGLLLGDEAFIYATWLKGLRFGSPLFKMIDQDIYFQVYPKIIKALLQSSLVKIACLKESPDVIVGYSVSSGPKLHWVFVKEDWRDIGIAKDLMPADLSAVSHMTSLGSLILKEKYPKVVFNPFLQ